MTTQLFDLTYRVAAALGQVREGVATGGSTTTIADTVRRTEENDYFNGGTAWLLYDAGGAGGSPQSTYQIITDFAQTGGIITTQTWATAPAAGDHYAISNDRYKLDLIIQKINEALSLIGPYLHVDITTITTATDQTEYTLPNPDYLDLRQVYIQTNEDSDDNQWSILYNWTIQRTSTGTAPKLVLPYELPNGYLLKLEYLSPHSRLFLVADKLDQTIHPDRVIYTAAASALQWYMDKIRSDEFASQRAMLLNRAARAEVAYPLSPPPARPHRLALVWATDYDTLTDE